MTSAVRPYQVAIWGASGFVGQLVCERIAREYPNQLKVAIAGRQRAKLENVQKEMVRYDPSWKDVGIYVADAEDREAIDGLTRSTNVVISCAGPFRKYSSTVVASSVGNGTHYLDLTAELPWVRSNIRNYHETALKNKTKIVHFCGYDSVPMDLGTLLVVDTIRKRYNTGCQLVEQYTVNGHGGASGGTITSGRDIYASATPSELKALKDPYCLTPKHLDSRSEAQFEGMRFNKDVDAWMVPFVFAKLNIPVVNRSNALAKEPYGKNFTYREGLNVPNLPLAFIANFVDVLFDVVFEYSFFQGFMDMVSPKPGSGPSLDVQRKKGFWRLLFVGYPELPAPSERKSKPVYVNMEDNNGDPGYWSTSKMLLECALSLVFDKDKVEASAALEGGVLTPASAFGLVPLERLRSGGFVVDVSQ